MALFLFYTYHLFHFVIFHSPRLICYVAVVCIFNQPGRASYSLAFFTFSKCLGFSLRPLFAWKSWHRRALSFDPPPLDRGTNLPWFPKFEHSLVTSLVATIGYILTAPELRMMSFSHTILSSTSSSFASMVPNTWTLYDKLCKISPLSFVFFSTTRHVNFLY